ncbi:uncharacterized protein [Paramisgurnus dabryanus]|uniref:uncharacterized protein isoform X2 n=1 Tax=Paramisgurnus dabryanus TaxID=90735 RepID=UPI003CCF7E39
MKVLVLYFFIIIGVVGAPVIFKGHSGETADINCYYKSEYETNNKYLCKGDCIIGNKNIIIKSGSTAEDDRFSLIDNKTARVFTVTITDLKTEDEGTYWCAVETLYPFPDVYSEILLLVKHDEKTTERSTIQPTDQSLSSTVLRKQRKGSKKSPRITQSGISHHVLAVSTLQDSTAEEVYYKVDHKYQKFRALWPKNMHTTVAMHSTAEPPSDSLIYSTAEPPAHSLIYSTVEPPAHSLIYSTVEPPAHSLIYSTAEPPAHSLIYSTAEPPAHSLIYSTAEPPVDSTIYSTAEPSTDSMINSTAEPPADSTIYSTAEPPTDSTIYSTLEPPANSMINS